MNRLRLGFLNQGATLGLTLAVLGCGGARQSVAGPTPAQPAAAAALSLYRYIPAQIGAFRLTQRAVVGGLPTDSLFRYRDGSPTILTVIIYDVPGAIRVDADSQQWTRREGEKFRQIQDIQVQRGRIGAYEVAFSDTARFRVGPASLVEHSIATPVRYPNGVIAVDMQYLYLIGGKFVKVRATIPGNGWEQTRVPAFARELATRLASGIQTRPTG